MNKGQQTINNLLSILKGSDQPKAKGPIDLWNGKKPNSKMPYLHMTNAQVERLGRRK